MTRAPRDIDVLVVNYLTPDLTVRALRTVSGPGIHFYVWDNSADLPTDLGPGVRRYGDGTNHLFAAANNRMYELSGSELVLLLNPDVLLGFQALSKLADIVENRTDVWGVMPRLRDPEGATQNYLRRLPTTRSLLDDRMPRPWRQSSKHVDHYYCRDVDLEVTQLVEQPPAACLLVRRSRVGPTLFDERFPLFFNDVDLAWRMSAAGWKAMYVAQVTATHVGGASIERARARERAAIRMHYDRAAWRFARKNLPRAWALAPVVLARLVGAMVRR